MKTKTETIHCPHSWKNTLGEITQAYFWNETFNFGVLVLFPVNRAQWIYILRKNGYPTREMKGVRDKEIQTASYFLFSNERHVIAFAKRKPWMSEEGSIAHEAVHCIANVMRVRGIPLDDIGGEEAHAYAIGWLTEKLIQLRRGAKRI